MIRPMKGLCETLQVQGGRLKGLKERWDLAKRGGKTAEQAWSYACSLPDSHAMAEMERLVKLAEAGLPLPWEVQS